MGKTKVILRFKGQYEKSEEIEMDGDRVTTDDMGRLCITRAGALVGQYKWDAILGYRIEGDVGLEG